MAEKNGGDLESAQARSSISHWKMITDQGVLTPEIVKHSYDGAGTEDDPYVVTWIDRDPRNPLLWPVWYKWCTCIAAAFGMFAVSLCSSLFTGGMPDIHQQFGASQEVITLGLSLFVLGFAVGPLLWAPMSELVGRQIIFFGTFGAFAVLNAGTTGAKNVQTIIVLRFLAGSFGSSPFTNAGGVVADCFVARERGLAMSIFSAAPWMGPVLGPIIGGFLGQARGWVWIEGLMAIFSGFIWIMVSFIAPETYGPVLLRRRAENLTKLTGKVHRTRTDVDQGHLTFRELMRTSLLRPWILLIKEPIVLLLSIYMAIIYGTLYLLFGAFPIVYQQQRGWSEGIGGLSFIGVMIGMLASVPYNYFVDNKRYLRAVDKHGGFAPPEARLPVCQFAALIIPTGLIWFAWTNYPTLPWAASVAAGIPFGFGMVLCFLGIMNYLVDAYTIFAASVLAANSIIRSVFGAVFPLFTVQMYDNLGIHWASMIPAFLALACVPFPFLFYKYGAAIRAHCKYAAEADAFMKKLQGQLPAEATPEEIEEVEEEAIEKEEREIAEDPEEDEDRDARFQRIKSRGSERPGIARANKSYDNSPFDLDRVNTKNSFQSAKSKERNDGSKEVKSAASRASSRARK